MRLLTLWGSAPDAEASTSPGLTDDLTPSLPRMSANTCSASLDAELLASMWTPNTSPSMRIIWMTDGISNGFGFSATEREEDEEDEEDEEEEEEEEDADDDDDNDADDDDGRSGASEGGAPAAAAAALASSAISTSRSQMLSFS